MKWSYLGYVYYRFTIFALFLTIAVIGCLIGFIVTGAAGALIAAVILGVIDFIIICAIIEPLIDFAKYLSKGFKTGEWE